MPNTVVALSVALISAVLLSWTILYYKGNRDAAKRLPQQCVALIVTAHPDDECMFFAPLIRLMVQNSNQFSEVYLLCLSTGNYDNLGNQRQQELLNAASVLGLDEDHVFSLHHPSMLDSPHTYWESHVVSDVINDFVRKNKVNCVFTFDDYGVSGHRNHISVYNGVKRMIQSQNMAESSSTGQNANQLSGHGRVQAYALQSVYLIRKYIGPLDLILVCSTYLQRQLSYSITTAKFSALSNKRRDDKFRDINDTTSVIITSDLQDVILANQSMLQHGSQMVWFRRLYIVFSRYMYVNSFKPIQ
ncbi:hypothetical protein MP228_012937 [Amoeboaphelidium protococcarum]|nr:hypothetical protein MP228_012937 [Amoeboaphelidium protococcarum]